MKSRISLWIMVITILVWSNQILLAADYINLKKPIKKLNANLVQVYKQPPTPRYYANKYFSKRKLSTILWLAQKQSQNKSIVLSPKSTKANYINLYVLTSQGVYKYLPKNNKLVRIAVRNIKDKVAKQAYVSTAPYIVLITADLTKVPFFLKADEKINVVHAAAGGIAEKIYTVSTALGIDTTIVGHINKEDIQTYLKFNNKQLPLYVMPLGYYQKVRKASIQK